MNQIQIDKTTAVFQFNPTPKQDEALEYLLDDSTVEILFGGGAGGGKSEFGCSWLVSGCLAYPQSRWLLGRSVLLNLKKSTLLTLWDVLKKNSFKLGVHYFYNQQNNVIQFFNGSEIYLLDLAYYPGDENYDRIGSTEFTGAFIDEVNQITFKAKETVKSRIRYKHEEFGITPKLLMSCNPAKNWVYTEFYKPWKDKRLSVDSAFVPALAKDNPHVSESYINVLKNLKHKPTRERLYNGNWEYDDDINTLFHLDPLNDMFTNTIDESDVLFLTCDAARKGRDKAVIMVWKGLKLIYIKAIAKCTNDELEQAIIDVGAQFRVPRSHWIVDEDGVGGGIVDHLKCKGFVGNATAIQPEEDQYNPEKKFKPNYANLRSQCYYMLSDIVAKRQTSIDIENSDFKHFIVEELEQIKSKDIDKDTKLRIISKEEIKEALGRSPDFADCMMMRMYFEVDKPKNLTLKFI